VCSAITRDCLVRFWWNLVHTRNMFLELRHVDHWNLGSQSQKWAGPKLRRILCSARFSPIGDPIGRKTNITHKVIKHCILSRDPSVNLFSWKWSTILWIFWVIVNQNRWYLLLYFDTYVTFIILFVASLSLSLTKRVWMKSTVHSTTSNRK
jgi:hypothetical protein